jgi:hypothetical protein
VINQNANQEKTGNPDKRNSLEKASCNWHFGFLPVTLKTYVWFILKG